MLDLTYLEMGVNDGTASKIFVEEVYDTFFFCGCQI